jgi:hypothetical protein
MTTHYKKAPKLWRWKSHSYNWVFFILALGIAVYTELFYHQRPAEKITSLENDGLPKLRAESINSILLQNKMHMIRLSKDASGHWFSQNIEKNTKVSVREEFINGLISTLSSLNLQKYLSNDSLNRANFSLNEPLATMTVSTVDGRTYRMKIGISNPISKSSYLIVNDSPKIFQIDVISNRILNFHQEEIFDDRIFSFTINKMQSIVIDWPGISKKEINLAKDLQKWVNAQNAEIPSEQVNSLLKVLRNIKSVKMFHPQIDEQIYNQLITGFNQSTFKISVQFQEESYQFQGTRGNLREVASYVKGNEYYLIKEINRNEISVMSRDDFQALNALIRNFK